jgi:hypothetical protein
MREVVAQTNANHQSSSVGFLPRHEAVDNFSLAEAPQLRAGLTIDDIAHPAYMVNYNFELTWYNEFARQEILGFDVPPPGTESRNIFRLLPDASGELSSQRRSELISLYVSLGKLRLSKPGLLGLVKHMDLDELDFVGALYEKSDLVMRKMVVDFPCALADATGTAEAWRIYGIYFREGILIIHVPADEVDPDLLEFISRRDIVVRNLMRKQLPVYSPLAVLVADLKNSLQIRSELSPDEYFALIDEIWATMAPVFRKHFGTYGNHVGDGIRYFFLPQPDTNYVLNAEACARELKNEMTKFSQRWQQRDNRRDELELNVWLHEGQEWLGALQAAANVNYGTRADALRAIKNLGSKLMAKEGARLGSALRGEVPAGNFSNRLRDRDAGCAAFASPGAMRTGATSNPFRLWELAKCA